VPVFLTSGEDCEEITEKLRRQDFSRFKRKPAWYKSPDSDSVTSPVMTFLAFYKPDTRLYYANWNGISLVERLAQKFNFQRIGPVTALQDNEIFLDGENHIIGTGTLSEDCEYYEDLEEQLRDASNPASSEIAIRNFLKKLQNDLPHLYSGHETYMGSADGIRQISNVEADLERLKDEPSKRELEVLMRNRRSFV